MYTQSRSRRTTLVAVFLFCISSGLWAQESDLTDSEREKVDEVIALMKDALGTDRDLKFRDFTTVNEPPYDGYYIYTFGEACDWLTRLNAKKRVVKAPLNGGAAFNGQVGIEWDKITIDSGRVAALSSPSLLIRVSAKIHLAANLINEMTHLMQHGGGTDARKCQYERDSDKASIKVLCKFLDALTDPSGAPHTTLAAVAGDAQAIGKLTACLTPAGGGAGLTPAEFTALHAHVEALKAGYQQRVSVYFDSFIAAGTSWVSYYTNGGRWKRTAKSVNILARVVHELQNDQGTALAMIPSPAGRLIVNATTDPNGAGDVILASLSHASGALQVDFWRDTTGDGLPEPGIVATTSIPGLFGDPGLHGAGMYILPMPALGGDHLIVHDTLAGTIHAVPLDAAALPIGPSQLLINDPVIANGGHAFLVDVIEFNPGVLRFLFVAEAPTGLPYSASTVAVDYDVNLQSATVQPGPVTLAQAQPFPLKPGLTVLPDTSLAALVGSPGSLVTATDANGGPFVVQSLISPTGLGQVFPVGVLPPSPSLVVVSDGSSSISIFSPRDGRGLDFSENDENFDGALDRVDLSTSPPRLNLGLGNAGNPTGPGRQHVYELVLSSGEPISISNWTPTNRSVRTLEGTIDFQPLFGSVPPLFIQGTYDFDGDNVANESCIIRRGQAQPFFVFESLINVLGAPQPVQFLPLPLGFVPGHFDVLDIQADGSLDVCIQDFAGGPSIRVVNDGSGVFQVQVGPERPGSGEDFELFLFVNNEAPVCSNLAPVVANDFLGVWSVSPFGTFIGDPLLVIGQFFTPGFPPPGIPTFDVHFNLGGVPAPFALVNGAVFGPLGPGELIQPGGNLHTFLVPPGLSGLDLMLQSLALDPTAQNGFFATSSGNVVRIE